ncbi:DUF6252 family protein [Hymenobacter norwichensis]|uniref:DUF6252 family protein n=1 Tax=Hymenobacter norwichensis TaxID=223903 RepID=UPI0003B62257|nr:DUF6252 family protein [Hymenobacter norwichensis]
MPSFRYFYRSVAPLLCGVLLLSACGNDKDDDDAATAGDGTVTWTHNGTTYTSTMYSAAVVDGVSKLLVTGASADLKNTVSLALEGIDTKGANAYDLRKGSVLDNLPSAALTLSNGTTGTTHNTLYGPSASNGTITVTQYDKAGQKISGTFSFTAGAVPNTSATGTQAVTNGSFSFTKFR